MTRVAVLCVALVLWAARLPGCAGISRCHAGRSGEHVDAHLGRARDLRRKARTDSEPARPSDLRRGWSRLRVRHHGEPATPETPQADPLAMFNAYGGSGWLSR